MKISINQLQTIILKELGIKSSKNILSEASLKDRIKNFQTIIGVKNPTGDWVKDKTDEVWREFLKGTQPIIAQYLPVEGDIDLEKIGTNWKDASGHPGYPGNLKGITQFAGELKQMKDTQNEMEQKRKAAEIEEKLLAEKEKGEKQRYKEFYKRIPATPTYSSSGSSSFGDYDLNNIKIKAATAKSGTYSGGKEKNKGAKIDLLVTYNTFGDDSDEFTVYISAPNLILDDNTYNPKDPVNLRVITSRIKSVGNTGLQLKGSQPHITELQGKLADKQVAQFDGRKITGKGLAYLVLKAYNDNIAKIKPGAEALHKSMNPTASV